MKQSIKIGGDFLNIRLTLLSAGACFDMSLMKPAHNQVTGQGQIVTKKLHRLSSGTYCRIATAWLGTYHSLRECTREPWLACEKDRRNPSIDLATALGLQFPWFQGETALKGVFNMVIKAYQNIIYQKKPPIAYVTLNRPEKVNALSADLQTEVRDALEDAGWADNEIRVIIIKGAGRSFSSGFDISGGGSSTDAVQIRARFLVGKGFSATTWWDVFWNNPKPLIAEVHGFCIAGGLATATFCDLRICSENTLFGAPEIRTGGPYIPAVWPWIIGMTKARELLYTGNLIDAQEAYRLGLVNKVVPGDKLEEEANKLARTIAKLPTATVEYNKKLINMAYELMNIRLVMERSSELEAICLASSGSLPEVAEFQRLRQEKGLKAALDWNSARFAEEDAWWKERRGRA